METESLKSDLILNRFRSTMVCVVIPPFTDSRENKSPIGSVDPDRIAGGLVP